MISEALAGKRIAVTGATGFLGTALVERLLRAVPDCEVVVLVRPGRRSIRRRPRPPRDPAQRRLRPAARASWATTSTTRSPAGSTWSPATSPSTASASTTTDARRLAACDIVIHSAAARQLRLAARHRGRGQPARPGTRSRRRCNDLGSNAHLVAVSTAYVAGSRRGHAPEALLPDTPFATDVDWRAEVAAARRARADVDAASRQPDALARFHSAARHELGAAGTPLLAAKTEKLREEWVDDRWSRPGRARARVARLARRLRLHQGARRAGAARDRAATCPVTIVRPSIIESALAEPRPGLDPRLPHGRAGDHLLRPRPAEGVPRHPRGRGRRHPGRPRRRRHHRGRRHAAPTPTDPTVFQVASGSAQPAALPPPGRPRRRLVHRAPALRHRRPAHRRARVVVPRPRPRAGPARSGRRRR